MINNVDGWKIHTSKQTYLEQTQNTNPRKFPMGDEFSSRFVEYLPTKIHKLNQLIHIFLNIFKVMCGRWSQSLKSRVNLFKENMINFPLSEKH